MAILETATIKQAEKKEKIKKEYHRRMRNQQEIQLYSRTLIKGINTWAVPFIRYLRLFLKWTREELQQMDQRTEKTHDDAQGPKSQSRYRETICVKGSDHIKKRKGWQITATRNSTNKTRINRSTITKNRRGKNNNCMDISSDKQAKSHTRRLGHG